MQNVFKVLGYVKHIWRQIALVAAISIFTTALSAIQPYGYKLIVDELVKTASNHRTDSKLIWLAIGALLVLRVVSSIANYFSSLLGNRVYSQVFISLRDSVFRRLTTLSLDYFEKNRTGEIMQRASGNVAELANWVYSTADGFLSMNLTIIFALVLIFVVDWRAGIVMSIAVALFMAQQVPTLRQTRPMGKKSREEMERAGGYLQETITHIHTVRSFGGEPGAIANHLEAIKSWRQLQYDRLVILQRSILFRQLTNSVAIIITFGIITLGALNGTHTAGDILLVSLYLQQITQNIWSLGRFIVQTNEIDITAERIVGMLEIKPTVVDGPDARELTELKTIMFKDVSFHYPGKRRKVLQNINFQIDPGQSLALVGPSGTGKTTITKLLLRFYEPTDGEILINDEPIRNFTQDSIREKMGVVMQDVALFNDTVEANLKLAQPEATHADVIRAAEQAHANVFIEKLPEKYKALVGERGVKLSGGEKQRVAIARAILKNPQLIILDEATSALDSESEHHVQAGLSELMEGRSSVIIAHRLSTVMKADQILVLKDNKIVERGTHTDLADKSGGLYAKLFKLQTEGFVKA
ncbi:MAG TPA: ABC transporter ATP-binding protein [Candidatus Saccharimonadales bacterium]|nr:ABC transporter ATP-binding protein [Candidatus Saccharimonadales bacterium]